MTNTIQTNTIVKRSEADEEAIDILRRYLRIKTAHPDIDYDECIQFLKGQADSLGLPYQIYHCAPKKNKPIFVLTWTGKEPKLPAIWLNSHMDVVPAFDELWKYKPFEAHMDESGNIYARGIQDTKALGIQYLEAVKRLRKQGITLKRTIHIGFVPEEEVNSNYGMKDFTLTKDFQSLNIGFALDEGSASPTDEFSLYYGERVIWQIRVHCPGQQGHGSLLVPQPPGDKISAIINKFNDFRAEQLKKLTDNPKLSLGDVITINLTKLEGGVQANVVPPEFIATYDLRIPTSVDLLKLEGDMHKWCHEAGTGVWYEFSNKDNAIPHTSIDDSNIFWTAFKTAADNMNLSVIPKIHTGGSDALSFRDVGIPAFGFSPMNNTSLLHHDNNECLNANIFLKGIEILIKIVNAISNAI